MGERRGRTTGLVALRAVFLDRDGVLNEPVICDGRPYPPAKVDDLRVCDGAREALDALRDAGFILICVTNQPDVARGTVSKDMVDAINVRLRTALPLDDLIVCAHDDHDDCPCRKPKPGMMIDASRRYGIDLTASYMVGDRWRDIEAGIAACCRTIFIDRGYDEKQPAVEPDARVASISPAAAWILADSKRQPHGKSASLRSP